MNPCLNGGVCIDAEPAFKCICHTENYGAFCEKSKYLFKIIVKNIVDFFDFFLKKLTNVYSVIRVKMVVVAVLVKMKLFHVHVQQVLLENFVIWGRIR